MMSSALRPPLQKAQAALGLSFCPYGDTHQRFHLSPPRHYIWPTGWKVFSNTLGTSQRAFGGMGV